MLNTPMALLAVATVVVGVNSYLFFGVYLPAMTTPTAPSSPPAQTERTQTTSAATPTATATPSP